MQIAFEKSTVAETWSSVSCDRYKLMATGVIHLNVNSLISLTTKSSLLPSKWICAQVTENWFSLAASRRLQKSPWRRQNKFNLETCPRKRSIIYWTVFVWKAIWISSDSREDSKWNQYSRRLMGSMLEIRMASEMWKWRLKMWAVNE